MGKKKRNKEKSNCCHAKVRIGGISDFIGDKIICTRYYICIKCNQPCDIYIPIRKTWVRKPYEQIIPNKKKKKSTKLTQKELKEIHKNEDF